MSDHDPDALADELSGIITALETTPDNVGLLRREIEIMRQLDMMPEALDATLRLSSLVMIEEDVWSAFFDESLSAPISLENLVQAVEHFDTAEKDHHSIRLLSRHAQFIVECTGSGGRTVDEDVLGFLTPDTVRGMLANVYMQSAGDLAFSGQLWNIWKDWEMSELLRTNNKAVQMESIHAMFLQRLETPHLDSEGTSSAYSTFCTKHEPERYEDRMVTATSTSQKAKAKLSGERRHGKTREDFEQQVALTLDPMSQIPILVAYMDWEMDPKAKGSGTHGPVIDPILIRSVTERTVAAYSLAASQSPLETQVLLKDGEASIWSRYIGWLQSNHKEALEPAMRATRACPQSPSLWGLLLHEMERRQCSASDLSDAFDRAQNVGAMFSEGSTSFIEVFVTRAAQQHRLMTADDGVDYTQIMETADRGFALLERLNKAGDPTFKLEKYLLEWAEVRAPTQVDAVLALVEKPLRSRSSSYQFTLLKAGLESRRGNVAGARQIFATAIQRSDLDWPEAVYEAYLQFEDVHGSVDSILQTRSKIAKETQRLARRRERQQEQSLAEHPVQETVVAPVAPVTIPQPEELSEVVVVETEAKEDNETKRDREHTTVLISGLAKGTSQALIESFFESCGRIRETTILVDESRSSDTALLEFRAVESVAPALAKDRRKLDGQEISVTMLWRSTLFITNFPRELDDVAIRTLFANYGHILQSRWPSRKYADNRRFCYLTMESPAVAEAALVLDGYKSDPDSRFGLTVRISDPSVKAKRSDEKDAVLFVGGLNAKTTEQDVRDLFKDKVSIRSLKLGWDAVKAVCKGFAFVTLNSEADAKEGLKLHGTSYRGKKLKVEQSDPNFNNKKAASDAEMKDKRSRTVRLNDIPAGMQEALLQQALEKIVPVRRLELFAKTKHAQAELENQADVGKLLLRSEPFVLDGATITITEHGRRQLAAPAVEQKQSVSGDALSFAPRAAKRGNTLGKGRHGATNVKAAAVPLSTSGNAQDAFRAVVDAKNKQREGNLESTRGKRSSDQVENAGETAGLQEAKKPKTG